MLLTVLVAMLVVHAFCFETFTVPSASMEPTFVPGDRIVVDKMAEVPRRGQVVVFSGAGSLEPETESHGVRKIFDAAVGVLGFRPDDNDYLKRIVAVGGDRVRADRRGQLLVNECVVREPYLLPGTKASEVPFDITVPHGAVFVLGDNRPRSNDSRNHLGDPGGGFVRVEKIIGSVSWRYWRG